MSEVLFERNGIRLLKFDYLTEEFRDQIESTILGREGKLRYQHTAAAQKATRLTETAFVQLHWKSRLIGVVAFSLQSVQLQNEQKTVAYVRYFSISGLLTKRQGQQTKSNNNQNSILKTAIKNIFDNPKLLFPDVSALAGIYAYVEEDNLPSIRNVLQMGFEKAGEFNTFLYSRASPKNLLNYQVLSPTQFSEILPLLNQTYKGYNFAPAWTPLLESSGRSYAVYSPEGIPTVGVCIAHNKWRIHSIPGITGWVSRNLLSKMPYLRRIFFDESFEFLTLEMAYIRDGEEQTFPKLVESILARNKKHHAIIWSDPNSDLCQKIRKGGHFGILQSLNQPTKSGLYFKAIDCTITLNEPCYISADGIS